MKTAVNVFFFLSYYLLFTVFYNITIIISYLIIYLFINWFILFFFFHFIPVRTCFICLVIILNLNFITLCKKKQHAYSPRTPQIQNSSTFQNNPPVVATTATPPPNVITIQMVNVYINFENWMCLCCYCALGCCSIWNMFIFVSTIMHL